MPLLADYAVTPDVFDLTSYSSEEVCGLHIQNIRDVMMTEGIVRDLRAGEWRALFTSTDRTWHRRAKELVKKLATQGRLIAHDPVQLAAPRDDVEWCTEALATHDRYPLIGGVIVTTQVKAEYAGESRVASVDRLSTTPWWAARSPSVRLPRTLAAYKEHLDPILRCSNSILFVDPHLDPAKPGYGDLAALISHAGSRTPSPMIEIHRVCYEGSGPSRRFPMRDDPKYFEKRFRSALSGALSSVRLTAEVFIWDDFHDRYLISNLIGVSIPNGFDTKKDETIRTKWTRLGRDDRDDTQREFDEPSKRHGLKARFSV